MQYGAHALLAEEPAPTVIRIDLLLNMDAFESQTTRGSRRISADVPSATTLPSLSW